LRRADEPVVEGVLSSLKKIVSVAVLVLGGLFGAVRADEKPVLERELWSVAVGTGADVFTVSLTLNDVKSPSQIRAAVYRVTIGIDSASGADAVIYARYTCAAAPNTIGATTNAAQASNLALNSGTALTKGCLYVFDIPETKGVTLNFRTGTTTVFRWFLVQRIQESQ
jgi:hypothetical protein